MIFKSYLLLDHTKNGAMLKVFADRGGTFTDIVAVTNNQAIINRLSQHQERF